MNDNANTVERVIGFDSHPDSFTAAILRGPTPAAAVVEKVFNKVPMAQLPNWVQKHTTAQDLIVLEAAGNSFQVVRTLAAAGRAAKVLESCQMGKLKEAHANNDKISAVRIGKAYLAGTAKEVWVPDPKTQERRDWFHAYTKAIKRATQMRARLRSYLSDNGVRLKKGTRLTEPGLAEGLLRPARPWSGRQWQVIEIYLAELRHADQQRQHWHSLIAQEVLAQPDILSLVRVCGVREITAFALAAFIGDIQRFAHPKNLVKYVGLNPAFDDNGVSEWSGGIGGHGHKLLRSLLIEGAQALMRSGKSPVARWGKKCMSPSLRLIRPKSMKNNEFIALDPGLLRHQAKAFSWRHPLATPGVDASAIQGRLSAQVALLQSPILPAANPPYLEKRELYSLPVDNTHTSLRRDYGEAAVLSAGMGREERDE